MVLEDSMGAHGRFREPQVGSRAFQGFSGNADGSGMIQGCFSISGNFRYGSDGY